MSTIKDEADKDAAWANISNDGAVPVDTIGQFPPPTQGAETLGPHVEYQPFPHPAKGRLDRRG